MMDKSKILRKYNNDDDKRFAAQILDYISDAQTSNEIKFTEFLDLSQKEIANELAVYLKFDNILFYGGYTEAEREMAAFYPEFINENEIEYPIKIVHINYPIETELSHRDILGALMGLGIKRNVIGDILKVKESFIVFVKKQMLDFILTEFKKAGKINLTIKEILGINESEIIKEFKEIKDTVASVRLDCVISLICRCGRNSASNFIKSGLVAINGRTNYNVTFDVLEGNILSVKGYGRFIIENLGPVTKKGRLFITAKKYL